MTDTPLPHPTTAEPEGGGSIFGPVHLTRAIIIATGIVFAVIFYHAARWLPWPSEPGFRGSLAQPPVALGGFFVAIILLVVCTFAGTFVAGKRWFLAGLMTATAGLGTWSVRGGTMAAVLFNAQNSGANQTVFLQMLGELIVFFGVIAALWNLIWNADRGTKAIAADVTTSAKDESRSTGAALLAQSAIMLIVMLILTVTPMKKQVLTSVFLAGVISTGISETFFADRRAGRWYWIAPLLVGVIGYIAGYFSPAGLDTGDLQGALAPLTRVLPLDYASMGCAGVLFGYWWMEPEVAHATPGENEVAAQSSKTGDGAA